MPIVGDGGELARKQRGDLDHAAIGGQPGLAVRLVDRAMSGEPGGVAAAAGEMPMAGNEKAAIGGDRAASRRKRAPGEKGRRRENLARRVRLERGREGRADRGLGHAPRRAGLGPGDLLDGFDEGRRRHLLAAEGARQQHMEQAGLAEGCDHLGRQFARGLDFGGGGFQAGCEGARPGNAILRMMQAGRLRGRWRHVVRSSLLEATIATPGSSRKRPEHAV